MHTLHPSVIISFALHVGQRSSFVSITGCTTCSEAGFFEAAIDSSNDKGDGSAAVAAFSSSIPDSLNIFCICSKTYGSLILLPTQSTTYLLGLTVNAFSPVFLPVIWSTCSCLEPSLNTVTPFNPSSCDKRYAHFTSSAVTSPGILIVLAIALLIHFCHIACAIT